MPLITESRARLAFCWFGFVVNSVQTRWRAGRVRAAVRLRAVRTGGGGPLGARFDPGQARACRVLWSLYAT